MIILLQGRFNLFLSLAKNIFRICKVNLFIRFQSFSLSTLTALSMPLGGGLEEAFSVFGDLRHGPRAEYYFKWSLLSFIICLSIHHIISPWIFNRYNGSYRNLSRAQKMEWDSRAVSSIHATIVSVLCVTALVTNPDLWNNPIVCVSHSGLIALSISIGYFLCDAVSMPFYWWNKQLIIFLLHHWAASFAFFLLVQYRSCVFFGVYRLTTELSTPFVNQRWFYRTIGYKPDRRRVACVTLIFAIFFIITRNLMIFPFWYIAYITYGSETYKICVEYFPLMNTVFITTCGLLDGLNIHWAFRTYRIGLKSIKILSTADWQGDIRKAQAKLHKRLRNLQKFNTHDNQMSITTKSSLTDNHLSQTSLDSGNSGISSLSSYSSDSEHESTYSSLELSISNMNQENIQSSDNLYPNTLSHNLIDGNDTELTQRLKNQDVQHSLIQ
ncbi:unnamed protein product [Heterobilharzia americana]|nr:unnamed protein product [Heterobilharzia americana]CAH8512970.1 unnamed protein product [Heterobilharzia americana]